MKLSEFLFSPWPELPVPLLLHKRSNVATRSGIGRWAGEPIICVGDYLEPHDLPSTQLHNVGIDQSLYAVARSDYNFLDAYDCERTPAIATTSHGRVLRNLTTKEYVRENGLSGSITLGHIVLLHICWSSHPSTSVQGGEDLSTGEWSGHCFDIVPLNAVEPD
ncbi:hypothetical protein BDV12DRAFT_200569 [Aspergillus spectabilis]